MKPEIKMTEQRRVILEVLSGVTTHPTADELFLMVRERLPRISLGTVYRNLETLAGLGLIARLGGVGGQMRFDGTVSRHFHVRCTNCGCLDDLPVEPAGEITDLFPGLFAFGVTGYSLEFSWICPECAPYYSEPPSDRAAARELSLVEFTGGGEGERR